MKIPSFIMKRQCYHSTVLEGSGRIVGCGLWVRLSSRSPQAARRRGPASPHGAEAASCSVWLLAGCPPLRWAHRPRGEIHARTGCGCCVQINAALQLYEQACGMWRYAVGGMAAVASSVLSIMLVGYVYVRRPAAVTLGGHPSTRCSFTHQGHYRPQRDILKASSELFLHTVSHIITIISRRWLRY
jgi:hypothetical protein